MKVSIVIPAYNEEKYIGNCLKSIFDQTVKPDEVIVVDNNCTDKTVKIAEKMGAKVIREKKQGMISARNRGFDEARYDIIARCDADVIVPKNWVAKIKKIFANKNIDGVSGPVAYYDYPLLKGPLPSKILYKSLGAITKGKKYLIGPNMSLRKRIWKKVRDRVNLDDKRVHEDIDLSLNIYKVGGRIEFVDSLVVKFSARRIIHNPESFFLEYPIRVAKTFIANKKKLSPKKVPRK